MRDHYARLFEPAFLADGLPNPRHLSTAAYLALARAAAHRGARRNGVPSARVGVAFPDAGFAPTRITVSLRGSTDVRLSGGRPPDRIDVQARATAELVPDAGDGMSGLADRGGYSGPLAYRQGKPMRPDVALAFDRMAAAARREAGLYFVDHERLPFRRRAGRPVGSQAHASFVARAVEPSWRSLRRASTVAAGRAGRNSIILLSVAEFRLQSSAFEHGEPIPRRHSCEGDDLSPPLAWSGAPEGARALALVVDDPDAPAGTFTHWVGWGLDPVAEQLGEGEAAPVEGRNDFGTSGYRGPCPPPGHGRHRYSFRLYALDSDPGLRPGAGKRELERAMDGHTLAVVELVGTYER